MSGDIDPSASGEPEIILGYEESKAALLGARRNFLRQPSDPHYDAMLQETSNYQNSLAALLGDAAESFERRNGDKTLSTLYIEHQERMQPLLDMVGDPPIKAAATGKRFFAAAAGVQVFKAALAKRTGIDLLNEPVLQYARNWLIARWFVSQGDTYYPTPHYRHMPAEDVSAFEHLSQTLAYENDFIAGELVTARQKRRRNLHVAAASMIVAAEMINL